MPRHQRFISAGRFRHDSIRLATVLMMVLPAVSWAQAPGRYQIDAQASRIEIQVFKGGLLGGFADNHVILLKRFSGTAEAQSEQSWRVRVVGESNSLQVVDPGASDSTRREIEDKMLGPTQIDAARYPTIEITSRSVVRSDAAGSWRMLADVTVHGVTRPVEFRLAASADAAKLRVRAEQSLRLRDFGIVPIRLALGTVQVRNEFRVIYDLVLQKQ